MSAETSEKIAREILAKVEAVIDNDHFVYTSGKHGKAYVNKDAIYPFVWKVSRICREIAFRFEQDNIEVVLAPAVGGVALSQWVAFWLSEFTGREVLALYAEKSESVLVATNQFETYIRVKYGKVVYHPQYGDSDIGGHEVAQLYRGDQLVKKYDSLELKRGYDKRIVGKRTLVVEDIINTGGTVRRTLSVARQNKAQIIGVAALCNRGGVSSHDLDLKPTERFHALIDIKMDAWDEAECPLCAAGVPVNTTLGKGKDFLARKQN